MLSLVAGTCTMFILWRKIKAVHERRLALKKPALTPQAIMEDYRLRCMPMASRHVAAVARLIADAFCDEPLNKMRGIGVAEMLPPAIAEAQRSAAEGLGTVCVAESTAGVSEVVGAFISADWVSPSVDIDADLDMLKFEPVFELIEALDAAFIATLPRKPQKGEILHQLMIGVKSGFARRGIARSLMQANVAQAREHGFRHVVMEATGRFAQAAAKRLGYVVIAQSVPYEQFDHNGALPFHGVETRTGHTHAELLMKTVA